MAEDDAEHLPPVEDEAEKHPQGSVKSWMLEHCSQISHGEITEHLVSGGHIKAAIIEAQDDCADPRYAVFLLASWRSSYHVLRVHWPARPRLFKDVGRLMALLRMAYGFKGPVAITIASPDPEKAHTRMAWRISV